LFFILFSFAFFFVFGTISFKISLPFCFFVFLYQFPMVDVYGLSFKRFCLQSPLAKIAINQQFSSFNILNKKLLDHILYLFPHFYYVVYTFC
jgi:hypothetical protein